MEMTQVQKYGHEHTRFSEIHLTRMVSETSPLHQPGGQTNQESDNPINKKLKKHLQKNKNVYESRPRTLVIHLPSNNKHVGNFDQNISSRFNAFQSNFHSNLIES